MRRGASLALLLGLLLAGCGLGGGEPAAREATITVTRDFGAKRLGRARARELPAGETVMRALQRRFDVRTRYGGAFVQSIGGVAGGGGRDWFYYVNGIEADVGATAWRLSPGDQVWWDHHDWGGAMRVPAVVGAFPEPFRSGRRGKRFPVRLDCARAARRACDAVAARLRAAGIGPLARTTIGQTQEGETLRVVVGRWRDVRLDLAARRIERGPQASGVFARFDARGRRLTLLDERGRAARSVGAGGALVAATAGGDEPPTWVVTGTDDPGVAAAASTLRAEALRDRFAVAVHRGRTVALPVPR